MAELAQEEAGAIIAAAGRGERMGGVDKAMMPLAGRPLIAWVGDAFQACTQVRAIALVLQEASLEAGQRLARERGWSKVKVCPGGARRQDSVREGLKRLPGCPWVVIHDGARPLVDQDLILRGLEAARESGAAVAAVPAKDTIKVAGAGGWVQRTPQRRRLWSVQTPQVFRQDLLEEAYRLAGDEEATDDASLVERAGGLVKLYPGSYHNIKVTTPEDLALAELLLRRREGSLPASPMQVGIGYDVHPLVAGRRLVLGGVEIPFPLGLSGHSDADLLCHALMDALLGAAALPDIGVHFPSNDPRYEGASSLELLRQVGEKVAALGWRVGNIDATIVAQEPRLAHHIPEMRHRLARALGIGVERVGVKATTTEGLGFAGEGKGMAAYAVALLRRPDEGL